MAAFPDLTAVPDAALVEALGRAPWATFDPTRDARRLRDRLLQAPADARRFALHQLGPISKLAVPRLQRRGITGMGVRGDGRLLAVGGIGDFDEGHAGLTIWDLDALRIVHSRSGIMGPVGWPDSADCVQWLPDGRLVMSHATNQVGLFDTFGGPEPLEGFSPDDGSDTPPGFVVGPGQVFVSCWGPGDAAGVVADARPGAAPRWIGEGCREPPWFVRWVGGEIVGHTERVRVVIDVASGAIIHQVDSTTEAWSPSTRWVVVGDVVRDARTDAVRFRLPDGLARREGGWRLVRFLDDDTVVAAYDEHVAIVSPGGVVRVDGRIGTRTRHPGDVSPLAVHPGGRIALLMADGHLTVVERDGTPVHAEPAGPVGGVLWASETRLIGASHHGLVFYDGDGRQVHHQPMLPAVGRTAPEARALPGDPHRTVARDRGPERVFSGVDAKLVHTTAAELQALLPELAWRIGDTAWPAEWMPPARRAPEPLPPPRAGPPTRHHVPPPTDTDATSELIRRLFPQGVVAPRWPVDAYYAPEPVAGDAVTDATFQALQGQLVLYAEAWRPEYPIYGVVVRLDGGWGRITVFPHGSRGSGPLGSGPRGLLAWIGRAELA